MDNNVHVNVNILKQEQDEVVDGDGEEEGETIDFLGRPICFKRRLEEETQRSFVPAKRVAVDSKVVSSASRGHLSHGYCTHGEKKVLAASIFFETLPYKVNPLTG
ncbi:serine transhydroxymethyltransferase [Medicago truncatula]|uniref:Serine transhydroxymethyltransferase n=1 Tax=Medicago truncatula TaxID=3880 RepID=A0A072V6G3_MEDTR|nr:serine transhydroxymethyltransferase [Medicago truncatula]